MRGRNNNRVENVRLVRLPNGQLVTEEQAKLYAQGGGVASAPARNMETQQRQLQSISQSELEGRKRKSKTKQKKQKKGKRDILEVWHEQERLKKESERLELEYQIAKKMAKDLKRQLKVRDQPHESVDEAFKDLLSPEVKDVARKLKPRVSKIKYASKTGLKTARIRSKKIVKFNQLLLKKAVSSPKHAIVSLGVIGLLIGVGLIVKSKDQPTVVKSDVQGENTQKTIPLNQKPEFGVLIPADKSAEQLGGFARVSPPESAAAYAYKDELGSVPIKVTQQELPEAFKTNPSEIENLAKKYNATELIQIDAVSVYSGVSEKGPQTLIFTKEGLLVFVVADRKLDDVQWVQYVTNLVKK